MPQAQESESRTRKTRVDPRLTAAGWKPAATCEQPEARELAASAMPELPTAAGPADYALCDGGTIRGVIEAKKLTLGDQMLAVARLVAYLHVQYASASPRRSAIPAYLHRSPQVGWQQLMLRSTTKPRSSHCRSCLLRARVDNQSLAGGFVTLSVA